MLNFDSLEEKIKSGDYSPKELYMYASLLYAQPDRHDESLEYYLSFIKSPGDMKYSGVKAYLNVHAIMMERQEYKKAFHILTDFESRNHHMSEFYCTLGDYHDRVQGDLTKAIDAFEQALKCKGELKGGARVPIEKEFYHFVPYMRLAELHSELKQLPKALEYYKEASLHRYNDLALHKKIRELEAQLK